MRYYKNKIYVAFDADNDIGWYRLLQAWSANMKIPFGLNDAHQINNIMPYSNESTIKRKLMERLKNSKIFMILVGEQTKYLYKYVRWEIVMAIKLKLPIIVVNLNQRHYFDFFNCPPILRNVEAQHISFNLLFIQAALTKANLSTR
jgi:hypothetical protein